MKAALVIAMVGGLSTTAMAEAKVGGSIKTSFGQYTNGDADAVQVAPTEANIDIVTKHEKMTAYAQIELGSMGDAYYKNTRRAVSYQMSDMIGLKIGTVNTGVPFSIVSGLKTRTIPGEFVGIYYAFTEADGLNVGLKLTDTIKAELTLFPSAVGNPTSVDANGKPTAAYVFGSESGTSTQLGASGMLSKELAFKFSYLMSADDATSDSVTSTSMLLGVKYAMEGLSFSLDYQSKEASQGTYSESKSGPAIQVGADAGPGKVVFTYASDSGTSSDASAVTYSNAWMNLAYQVAVDKATGFQVIYTSHTKTPSVGDAVTDGFIGGGLYAGF